MKTYYFKIQNLICKLLFVCVIILSAQGCSQESINKSSNLSEQEMMAIGVKYLFLDKDNFKYTLKLSEKEAETLGISASCYAKMIEDVSSVNISIEDTGKNDPNKPIHLVDPQSPDCMVEIKTVK
jgi:hypothetical protein